MLELLGFETILSVCRDRWLEARQRMLEVFVQQPQQVLQARRRRHGIESS